MASRKIQVEIIGDSRSLERAFRNAGRSGSTFGRTMSGLAKGAAFAGTALGAGLASQVYVGLKALARIEKISAQTDAALRSTGGAANVTRAELERMASALEKTTSVEAETIQEGQNLLLTFTKIRNAVGKGNKVFDRATETIVDMSVALGQDMKSSAIQLGKALNDPIRGVTALRRVGVSFTKDQQDQIRALAESGRLMEAQKLILRELSVEFGNSGRALGRTLEGRMRILGHLVGEVQEAFAKGFLPVLTRVAKVLTEKLADPKFVKRVEELGKALGEGVLKAVEAVGEWFQRNWPAIQQAFRTGAELARKLADAARFVADRFRDIASITPGGATTLLGVIIGGVLAYKLALALANVKLLNRQMLLLAARTAPVVAALLAIQEFGSRLDEKKSSRFIPDIDVIPGVSLKRVLGIGGGPEKPPPPAITSAGKGFRGREGGGRALGGPVLPGVAYRVGERGPEMFVPRMAGTIVPGGGGIYIANVTLPGVTNARQFLADLQRLASHGAAQTRGRHGGLNLALN